MQEELENWKQNEHARFTWNEFLLTKEFKAGLRALESQAVPIIVMGEPQEQTAKRQSFQAGFHTALRLIQKLPDLHYKKIQNQLPEWDYIEPIEKDE